MILAFKIALRFLSSNKGQTILIALGIAIGISVQIFIGSLIEGLQISLIDATIGKSSHITLQNEEKTQALSDYEFYDDFLKNYDSITASTPTLSLGGFLSVGENFDQILYRGFPLERANEIYKFEEALLDDSQLPKKDQILMGYILAENNKISIGDRVNIVPPEGQPYEVQVSGFIDLKVNALNESWIIGSLQLGQAIYSYESNMATSIELQIDEPFEADILSEQMTEDLDDPSLFINNWKASNEQLLSGLTGQSTSSLMIQVFVVISVVLGIASVLAITVLQKSKQIGILKAMGINDRTSSYIFLSQGFILGVLGGILGIIFGIALLFVFSNFALNPDGSPVVPIFINPMFIGLSGLIAILASTGASIIPALKSKKLSPIEVIRNG
jgi:lipoprotein-releasing system permease protein